MNAAGNASEKYSSTPARVNGARPRLLEPNRGLIEYRLSRVKTHLCIPGYSVSPALSEVGGSLAAGRGATGRLFPGLFRDHSNGAVRMGPRWMQIQAPRHLFPKMDRCVIILKNCANATVAENGTEVAFQGTYKTTAPSSLAPTKEKGGMEMESRPQRAGRLQSIWIWARSTRGRGINRSSREDTSPRRSDEFGYINSKERWNFDLPEDGAFTPLEGYFFKWPRCWEKVILLIDESVQKPAHRVTDLRDTRVQDCALNAWIADLNPEPCCRDSFSTQTGAELIESPKENKENGRDISECSVPGTVSAGRSSESSFSLPVENERAAAVLDPAFPLTFGGSSTPEFCLPPQFLQMQVGQLRRMEQPKEGT
ncbi:hypothetical protein DFH07DRAFT_777783 [Mycena maculata]|uniref:Uncharacterized protein n=1 Tax=Mycena maculata TaxID=230809 RepID=A0AAD7IIF4_9AGAR|nr:hypothetical protein DFH07DRAFT_777783 [Mycena maculata]